MTLSIPCRCRMSLGHTAGHGHALANAQTHAHARTLSWSETMVRFEWSRVFSFGSSSDGGFANGIFPFDQNKLQAR